MNDAQKTPLKIDQMDPDPFTQFARWYQEAEQAGIALANAMCLATATAQGQPSARMVLLKDFDARGFVFYTNDQSRKGRELEENPCASLVFYWLPLSRQVRIEGAVEHVTAEESDAYFASRPRSFQLGAHASRQSQVIEDREILDVAFEKASRTFSGQDVSRPAHWGGYRVVPEAIEFWQEGENRLHDRLRYRRNDSQAWEIDRLAP
ncbi:MAG: pyridoxamine 5'-phosphate oxidase [Desulfuromonadales bacterium]